MKQGQTHLLAPASVNIWVMTQTGDEGRRAGAVARRRGAVAPAGWLSGLCSCCCPHPRRVQACACPGIIRQPTTAQTNMPPFSLLTHQRSIRLGLFAFASGASHRGACYHQGDRHWCHDIAPGWCAECCWPATVAAVPLANGTTQ